MRQPWLEAADPPPGSVPDLFTRNSPVRSAGKAGIAVAVAVVVLILGTTTEQAKAVWDLPNWPGADLLTAAVEHLDGAARAIGLDRPHAALRALVRRLEEARFD
ncbi:hypothetical protein EDC65_4055 [Stella humosa]|uniref:Uncharacterized protein n=1 Tax=Stella humosa TaxID=94 RepID=A0A3N1L139_9PROT|nr:hypothetical protein [Stella humosa]ROP84700.1 hypothetical protein EDC65_4055 [Stella humosa]BBK34220.1 hypothetical protein STHU_48540 [Stella humosa]